MDESIAKHRLEPNSSKYEMLFSSEFFTVHDFTSFSTERIHFNPKVTSQFCINLPRAGYYTYHAFRQKFEEHHTRVLIEKPDTVFKLVHEKPGMASCTIILFNDKGFNAIKEYFQCEQFSFFKDRDRFCDMFGLSPIDDYLHLSLLAQLKAVEISRLQVELLVFELAESVLTNMTQLAAPTSITDTIKVAHLEIIENAKLFLYNNMSSGISLNDLARHCFVSPFHLARLFKGICGYSPFHYLQKIRLKYAESLLINTSLPITDICYRCGYTRLDHFSTSFSKQFSVSPSNYKARRIM
jgi:AraC family transcriptional regulator